MSEQEKGNLIIFNLMMVKDAYRNYFSFPHSEKVEIRGAEARTYHIAKHLVKNHEVTVITSREEGTQDGDILGMRVLRVGRSRRYSQSGSFVERPSFMREAIKEGREQDFDVVEGTNFLSYPPAWKVGESLGIPRVMTYHDVWLTGG